MDRMQSLAQRIAEVLHLEEPDYDNFKEVLDFIDEYRAEFFNTLDGRD